MAETGNTMWNGNYGADEKKRRETYDRAKEQAKVAVDKEKKDQDAYTARIGSTKGF